MRFASLGSGSRGNCTVVASDNTTVLIDCGFNGKETARRLQRLSLTPQHIDAILLTHEHSDHVAGVGAFARKHDVPVYLTAGTFLAMDAGNKLAAVNVVEINSHGAFDIGDMRVQAVPVPHDAREPVQYVLSTSRGRLGVLTDLGSLTQHVIEQYQNLDALLLEFNHDRDMLARGPYPLSLKRRVGGQLGHLSNCQAESLLGAVDVEKLQHLVVAHVSEKNNCKRRVAELLTQALPEALHEPDAEGEDMLGVFDQGVDVSGRARVCIADQEQGFAWRAIKA